MKILLTGSSGLIGTALIKRLSEKGHDIGRLFRTRQDKTQPFWDIENGVIDLGAFDTPDVVIHLAGENLTDSRWNRAKKERIINSRVNSTKLLVNYFTHAEHKPRVFICGSAIGFYGNRGDETVDENSAPGNGFAAEICKQWETASKPATDLGIRLVNIRTGIVLSPLGGALKKMLLPFRLGLGGIIGNGRQYVSWVSIDDIVDMIHFVMVNESLNGPVNLVSPNPVTNYQFTKTLGKVLHRPTPFPLPAFMARILFGEMADELLLSSTRVRPEKLMAAGYQFHHTELAETFDHIFEQ